MKIKPPVEFNFGALNSSPSNAWEEGRVKKVWLGLALGMVVMGLLSACGGYVSADYGENEYNSYGTYGPYGYGGDIYLFGGNFERGRDVRSYSHRGAESRGASHHGGPGGHH